MLTISRSISASQARDYHNREFAAKEQNYWSRDQEGYSQWQGKLAQKWGLEGPVDAESFARLSEGIHPKDGQQLVRHQTSRTYENNSGKTITSVEHRAGWDAVFSAPKSVSIAALVGGDERIRIAHRDSVSAALSALEEFSEARIGNVKAPERTGKFAAAVFEHDTARPVDGYAAPQLHSHAVIFNISERENGECRALQPKELFDSQRYATGVYRCTLASQLKDLGYELTKGEYGQPEIVGISQEYMAASSPRREQIKAELRETGMEGAAAAQAAAYRTRDRKEILSRDEVLQKHRDLADQYGNQADIVVARALALGRQNANEKSLADQQAITFARDHIFERTAVANRRDILTAAFNRALGNAKALDIYSEFERRVQAGEFCHVKSDKAGQYTTAAIIRREQEIIGHVQMGNKRELVDQMLVSPKIRIATEDRHPELNASQRHAVDEIFLSREKIVGIDGLAGTGKTTTLAVIREGAEADGYKVAGLAPTSRAAQKLAEAGIETTTLQMHLARGQQPDTGEKRLFVMDESSLASAKQMQQFFNRLCPSDTVLVVGDRRQHQSVDAGAPFEMLQIAGMKTVTLDEIVRQKDPDLKAAVELLAKGEVRAAVLALEGQGRIHEIKHHQECIAAVSMEYAKLPKSTLVVAPDNITRTQLNERIHLELQAGGLVADEEHSVKTLVPRQNLTGAERAVAERYEENDILRYARSSKVTGLKRGEYVRVIEIDVDNNRLLVERADGTELTYDPSRHQGVSIYREQNKDFSVGDRIQFTQPANDLHVANHELATIEAFGEDGQLNLKVDSGRNIQIDPRQYPHLDHGYALTSHSSQGQTADRVLILADTKLPAKDLLNSRFAYVSVSRGKFDAQIFTDESSKLAESLGHEVSQQCATAVGQGLEQSATPQNEMERHDTNAEHLELGQELL